MTEEQKPPEQLSKLDKNLLFEEVVKATYNAEVKKFDKSKYGQALQKIAKAIRNACVYVQKNPIERSRPNEVGNDMEDPVIKALKAEGISADRPKTKSGKDKITGYPDIKITNLLESPIFLEVKTYAAKNRKTTQRSFYLSNSEDHKVTDDAYHLLVGFQFERHGNFFTPVAFKLIDLYGLECDIKTELNSDNKRLYEEKRILLRESM